VTKDVIEGGRPPTLVTEAQPDEDAGADAAASA
jgi:hypothetical protein